MTAVHLHYLHNVPTVRKLSLPAELRVGWQLSVINAAVETLSTYEVTRTELAAQKKQLDATLLQKQQAYQTVVAEHTNALSQQKQRVSELEHAYTAANQEHLRKDAYLKQSKEQLRIRIVRHHLSTRFQLF